MVITSTLLREQKNGTMKISLDCIKHYLLTTLYYITISNKLKIFNNIFNLFLWISCIFQMSVKKGHSQLKLSI